MRPVALIIRLLTGVKAIISGVYITPPPMPAKTETIARAKLSRKKPKSIPVILVKAKPPGGMTELLDIRSRAI
jgi:hypothetical protein